MAHDFGDDRQVDGAVNFRLRHVDLPGVRLHVAEAGPHDGPLVILLHGFPEFWWSWRHQVASLSRAGYRVVAPDMRGFHRSSSPRGVRPYRIERLTRDVWSLIASYGRVRASVVGHDWGGLVAWYFAMRFPSAVERLAVLNMPHPRRFAQGLRTRDQLFRSRYIAFFSLPFLPEYLLTRDDHGFVRRVFELEGFSAGEVSRFVEAARHSRRMKGPLAYYRALVRDAVLGRLPTMRAIDRPCLVLVGERDRHLSPRLAEPEPDWVPQAKVVRVPGASHWLQQDAPEVVTRHLAAFLGGVEVPRQESGKPLVSLPL